MPDVAQDTSGKITEPDLVFDGLKLQVVVRHRPAEAEIAGVGNRKDPERQME